MNPISDVLRPLASTLRTSTRLWVRHWPALLVIALLAQGGHEFFLSMAVVASRLHAVPALLLLPLAPLSVLVGYIVILRLCATSFPLLPQMKKDEHWARSLLPAISASLLAFLALYASQGTWKQDLRVFLRDVYTDHVTIDGFGGEQLSYRYGHSTPLTIIALILLALAIRALIKRWKLTETYPRLLLLSGYLEALWIVSLGGFTTQYLARLTDWFNHRALVFSFWEHTEGIREWWNSSSFPIPEFISAPWADVNSALATFIITPLATLTVAASVYGSQFDDNPLEIRAIQKIEEKVEDHGFLAQVWGYVTDYVADFFSTIRKTIASVRKVMSAGIGPVIVMAAIVACAGLIRTPLTMLVRWLIGPQADTVWFALQPIATVGVESVFMSIMVPIVATCSAAISRARIEELVAQSSAEDAPVPSADPAPADPAPVA